MTHLLQRGYSAASDAPLVLHGPFWSGLDWQVVRVWCLSFTIITSRASVWCYSDLIFLFFLFYLFISLSSVYNLCFFPLWWFPCLYRLCVYLNTNIILSCSPLDQDRTGRLSDGPVGFSGGMCVLTKATSCSCESILFSISFIFKKPLLFVSLSVCCTLAEAGVCKVITSWVTQPWLLLLLLWKGILCTCPIVREPCQQGGNLHFNVADGSRCSSDLMQFSAAAMSVPWLRFMTFVEWVAFRSQMVLSKDIKQLTKGVYNTFAANTLPTLLTCRLFRGNLPSLADLTGSLVFQPTCTAKL